MKVIGIVASFFHIFLLVGMYLVIPYVVPKNQQQLVEHWTLVSFSMIFLILTVISVRETVAVTVIILLGALIISGITWWIPTYLPEKDQELAIHILIIASAVMLTTISLVYSLNETESIGVKGIGTLETYFGGKRRR